MCIDLLCQASIQILVAEKSRPAVVAAVKKECAIFASPWGAKELRDLEAAAEIMQVVIRGLLVRYAVNMSARAKWRLAIIFGRIYVEKRRLRPSRNFR